MARLRLFAQARAAAGTASADVPAGTVGEVTAWAADRYGPTFAALLPSCQVWVNGEPAQPWHRVGVEDEVAIVPPVSGG